MTSVTEQRSIKSDVYDLDPQDDELEQMLAQAERLANEMRTISSKHVLGASHSSGFPETIQIKDKDSACSSMEVTNIFDPQQTQESESFSSYNGNHIKEDVIDEGNEVVSADGPEVEIQANISAESPDLSDLSGTRRTIDDVDAIVQASQEMARTLEAMRVSSPSSPRRITTIIKDTAESHTTDSSPRSLTPSPASPDSACGDSKATEPISHLAGKKQFSSAADIDIYEAKTKIEGGDVTWEKVDYTREIDEDYVPIADYSKKMTPPRKTVDKNGVKWEKLASPNRFDNDYTQLKDYSTGSPKRKEEYSFAPDPLPAIGNQRRSTLRRLKKRQKRVRMAILFFVLAGLTALAWWQKETLRVMVYQVRLAAVGPSSQEIASAEKLAAKAAAEEAVRYAKEKKAAAEALRAKEEAERLAREKKAKEEEDARKRHAAASAAAAAAAAAKEAMEKAKAVDEFKSLCGNPLVSFVSPVCHEKKDNLLKQYGVTNPLTA